MISATCTRHFALKCVFLVLYCKNQKIHLFICWYLSFLSTLSSCNFSVSQPLEPCMSKIIQDDLFFFFSGEGTEQKLTCIPQVVVCCKWMLHLFLLFPCYFLLTLAWRKIIPSQKSLSVIVAVPWFPVASWKSRLRKNSNIWKWCFVHLNIKISSRDWRWRWHPEIWQQWPGSHQARSQEQIVKALCLHEWQQDHVPEQLHF